MISKRLLCFFLTMVLGSVALRAQTTLPALTQALPTRTLVAGGASASIHLREHFAIAGVGGNLVQFDTSKGKFNVELFSVDTPKTVANFLKYTNRGDYSNNFIHRSVTDFVIQGGGFGHDGTDYTVVATDPPIENEPKFSNTRGTIAMAKTSLGPHTATSQWYINLKNNATPLDSDNGGYAVFGRVLGTGMTVVDQIAAVPVYNASAVFGSAFNQMPLVNYDNQTGLPAPANLVFSRIRAIPAYPEMASESSALTFSASSSDPAVATVEITASTLTIKPIATGTAVITARATDTNGNPVETTFTATVAAGPTFTTPPTDRIVAGGEGTSLSVVASAGAALQWQRNGSNLANIHSATVNVPANVLPELVGLYTVVATSAGASATTSPAILGVTTANKVIGAGEELEPKDILHPNGKTFDQVLLTGSAAAITAEYSPDPALAQITRMSYIDIDNNIVQVELAGPGTLTLTLEGASGPAIPTKYHQPNVSYMKGHASIVIAGATEQTNVTVFSVGRATAYDPTNQFKFLEPITAGNNPANNGSSLFLGHNSTSYTGLAGLARISISSANGKFGGIRAANVSFYGDKGYVGVYAPGVEFVGPVFIGDINASSSSTYSATPVIILGSAADVRITGGNLYQNNGRPVLVSGVTQLKFTAGIDSHGNSLPATKNQATLRNSAGENVTSQIVVNP